MTPAARVSAAIAVLDQWLGGMRAEAALKHWGRNNRYAGSSDRAAIRDLVFQAIRCRDSYAWLGGGLSGRALMIGYCRDQSIDLETIFSGDRFAPSLLVADEALPRDLTDAPRAVRLDWPEALLPEMQSYGDEADRICAQMRERAPVFIRVNRLRGDVAAAVSSLAADEIEAQPHPLSPTALEVTANARRLAQSTAYQQGLVELQDAASQAVVDLAAAQPGDRVLDFCAGGGGKSLALAAQTVARVDAHDANPARMRDLPARAKRAGADIHVLPGRPSHEARYDLVYCDVPCSGSGSWRRDPEGKWALTEERLGELAQVQGDILETASHFVRDGGVLVYATCSLFGRENMAVVESFLSNHPNVRLTCARQFTPLDGGDGFFGTRLVIKR